MFIRIKIQNNEKECFQTISKGTTHKQYFDINFFSTQYLVVILFYLNNNTRKL